MAINSPLFESGQWYLGGSGRCEAPNGCGSFNSANGIQYKDAIETYGFGQHEPIIAVIDSGFDIEHQDLVNKLWTCPPDGNNGACEPGTHGYSYYRDSPHPPFYHETYTASHGTSVASIIGAENSDVGMIGVCPNCRLMVLHSHSGQGGNVGINGNHLDGVEQAIYFAVNNGARVINISDSWSISPELNLGVSQAIQYATDNNVLIVVAGGNHVKRLEEQNFYGMYSYPNLDNNTLAVGGWEFNDRNYLKFTNNKFELRGNTFGVGLDVTAGAGVREILVADTFAPYTIEQVLDGESVYMDSDVEVYQLFNSEGIPIWDTIGGNPMLGTTYQPELLTDSIYSNFGGTSAATPHVSGLAGLLLSHNPNLTREDLINIITTTADDITNLQTEIQEGGGYGVEIDFSNSINLPYTPYSTSISTDEIPPEINVLSALQMLYGELPSDDGDDDGELPSDGFELGDINQDFSVDIQDVTLMVDLLLDNPRIPASSTGLCISTSGLGSYVGACDSLTENICSPEYGGTELVKDPPQWPEEWRCFWDTSSAYDYSIADMNGDGFIDIVDIVRLINNILSDYRTPYSDRQRLQLQLDKLNKPTETLDEQQPYEQTTKNRPKFKGNYLLTFEESNRIKTDNLVPLDLKNIGGHIYCLGKNNGYPCYWVTENNEESLENRKEQTSILNSVKRVEISERNLIHASSSNVAFYGFNISNIERKYNVRLDSNYVILAECFEFETAGVQELFKDNLPSIQLAVMGVDSNNETTKYCKHGQIPNFYIHNTRTKQEFQLNGNSIPAFNMGGMYEVVL